MSLTRPIAPRLALPVDNINYILADMLGFGPRAEARRLAELLASDVGLFPRDPLYAQDKDTAS